MYLTKRKATRVRHHPQDTFFAFPHLLLCLLQRYGNAVLERGCSAYIGSLWKVNDFSTMLLMTNFCRTLRDNDRSLSVAELFGRAQASLYLMDAQQRVDAVTHLLQELPPAELDKQNPSQFVKNARLWLIRTARKMQAFDLSHP
jgi:CHAT domain